MYLAYTYLITNKITHQFYYGSRYQNIKLKRTPEQDLWIFYFTSSKEVKKLLKEYNKDLFEISIVFKSENYDECYWQEQDLIKENIINPLCMNLTYTDKSAGRHIFSMAGKTRSEEACKKSSISLKAYHKNEPADVKVARFALQKAAWNRRSEESEIERIDKMIFSRNNKTEEEKLVMSRNRRIAQTDRVEEAKLISVSRQKETKANWSPEKREAFINKVKSCVNKGNAKGGTYQITDPAGNTYIIVSLSKFCRENNLPFDSMRGIAAGTQKCCKNHPGWRLHKLD